MSALHPSLWVWPFALQGFLMLWDEFFFHHRRRLGTWETWGHPLDTASVGVLLVIALFAPWTPAWTTTYFVLSVFSCVLVTKDESVHARECSRGEQHVHALLFVLHPVVLYAVYRAWWLAALGDASARRVLGGQAIVLLLFGLYQFFYWRRFGRKEPLPRVNLEVYGELGERWYTAQDDPIALLRAEARFRNPWLIDRLDAHARELGSERASLRVLDLGCGAGFLANDLAQAGFSVTGLDRSAGALEVARRHDSTGRVDYREGDALALPFPDASLDAVALMDFLEHVEDPGAILREVARVLKPGGLWFFHTFNRTRVAEWIAIRAVETFVKNVPPELHVLRLFIRPDELRTVAAHAGLSTEEVFGARPALGWQGIRNLGAIAWRGEVPGSFRFVRTPSLAVGYLGWGRRK